MRIWAGFWNKGSPIFKGLKMISKEKLKAHIDNFPEEEIAVDEFIDRLVFIEKLEKRISISEKGGAGLSEEAMKEEMERLI